MKFFLGLVVLVVACTVLAHGADTFVNTKLQRTIDLTTQLARHTIALTAENKGTGSISEYSLSVQNASNLAFIKAETEAGEPLTVTEGGEKGDYKLYTVNLGKVEGGKSFSFKVFLTYFGSLKPYPTLITQTERQLVRYYDNAYFFSPYPTSHQRTTVKLASTRVEKHSTVGITKVTGDSITYGPYSNEIAPFTSASLWVHFENNSPFLTITKMTKEYEVSHWGNLAVEQWIDARHDGATLKGQFSRFDFQRNPGASPSAILEITEILPLEASDVYYRDDIGNISTSSFAVSDKGLEFHIIPRFPLFGGWKNNFYTGYNLPLNNFLSTDNQGNYLLNVSFASSLGDFYTEDYTVKVILPEGSKVTKVTVPFSVDKSETKHFTYLDTTGRPVLVLSRKHIVPEHNVYFQVEYEFNWLAKWFEPLYVTIAFFVLLAGVMFFVRFNLSIKSASQSTSNLKREQIINSLRTLAPRIDAEFNRQNANEKNSETVKWNARPQVLEELLKVNTQATPAAVGDTFSTRVHDFTDAEFNRFKYQGKLHALRTASGSKKTKSDKEKKIQTKFDTANDVVQQFVEDWINP